MSRLPTSIAGRLRDERGMALVMAIGISFVLAILGASVIVFTTSNERHAKRQNATTTLYDIAQAGIDSAAAQLGAVQAANDMAFYRKVGCPRCNRSGYKGRIGVFQLLVMNDELEGLAAANAPRDEINRAAAAEGMRTLWDDGLAKVAAGLTSLEELARVVSG